ncbi:MAG: hypothetical protein IIZ74_03820, partial [Erysipelotrichaceae bacterium]|nr:hypothetical protein [Erysipelotrichaceae bacterium]
IDYDLDYKIFPDGTTLLLDEDEYREHSRRMNYPEEIDGILKKYQKELLEMYRRKEGSFSHKDNEERFLQYLEKLSK